MRGKRLEAIIIDVVVKSIAEDAQHLSLDPSRLDPKGLTGAERLVEILELTGSVTRGSAATGRVQTLTGAFDKEGGRTQVQIVGDGDKPLVTIETLRIGAPGMNLTLHGPTSDPTIDEAYGLGLHIGAAILAGP